MKKKKLLSMSALALALASSISISASAADFSKGDKREAAKQIVTNGLNGKVVVSGTNVTANTKVNYYLTDKFINETNDFLKNNELNVYLDGEEKIQWEIKDTDNLYDIQKNILKTLKSLDEKEKDDAVIEIRNYLLDKLEEFKKASNESNNALKEIVNKYFKTSRYGTLTVGINSDNAKTVTIEKSGKIVLQINSQNVYTVSNKLEGINNYEDFKNLVLEYYPDAQQYVQNTK